MDLIILALIAGFILYRLYTTLGEKTGVGEKMRDKRGNVVDLHKNKNKSQSIKKAETEEIPSHIRSSIKEIIKHDPEFSLREFIEGAAVAFEMIIDAYTKIENKTLEQLLSPDLYKAFKSSIDDRVEKGHVFENTIVKIEAVEAEHAHIEKSKARIKVKIVSEQVPITKDSDGEIIEGNLNQIDQVIDYWVFERNLKARDPNWVLVSTQA